MVYSGEGQKKQQMGLILQQMKNHKYVTGEKINKNNQVKLDPGCLRERVFFEAQNASTDSTK